MTEVYDQGLWPWFVLIFFGFLPSEIWRMLSVFLARGIDESSPWLAWVRAVATALLSPGATPRAVNCGSSSIS